MSCYAIADKLWPETEIERQRYQSDLSQRGKTIHRERDKLLLETPTKNYSQPN